MGLLHKVYHCWFVLYHVTKPFRPCSMPCRFICTTIVVWFDSSEKHSIHTFSVFICVLDALPSFFVCEFIRHVLFFFLLVVAGWGGPWRWGGLHCMSSHASKIVSMFYRPTRWNTAAIVTVLRYFKWQPFSLPTVLQDDGDELLHSDVWCVPSPWLPFISHLGSRSGPADWATQVFWHTPPA